MKGAIWNEEKQCFEQVEGATAQSNGEQKLIYFEIEGEQLKRLKEFVTQDGFDLTAETEQGRKMKLGSAVKKYAVIAIDRLIASRDAMASKAPAEPSVPPESKVKK